MIDSGFIISACGWKKLVAERRCGGGREQAQQHCCRKLLCRHGVNCCVHREPLHERQQPIAKNTSDAHLEVGLQVRVADAYKLKPPANKYGLTTVTNAHLEAGVQVRVADALVQQVAHLWERKGAKAE